MALQPHRGRGSFRRISTTKDEESARVPLFEIPQAPSADVPLYAPAAAHRTGSVRALANDCGSGKIVLVTVPFAEKCETVSARDLSRFSLDISFVPYNTPLGVADPSFLVHQPLGHCLRPPIHFQGRGGRLINLDAAFRRYKCDRLPDNPQLLNGGQSVFETEDEFWLVAKWSGYMPCITRCSGHDLRDPNLQTGLTRTQLGRIVANQLRQFCQENGIVKSEDEWFITQVVNTRDHVWQAELRRVPRHQCRYGDPVPSPPLCDPRL